MSTTNSKNKRKANHFKSRSNTRLKTWHPQKVVGYKPITKYYTNFSYAEAEGKDSIMTAYNSFFSLYKNDKDYMAELLLMLIFKVEEHFSNDNIEFALLYKELYEKVKAHIKASFEGFD